MLNAKSMMIAVALLGLVISCANASTRDVWEEVETTNEKPIKNVGGMEAVSIGEDIYVFGGLTENRTEFWLSGGTVFGWDYFDANLTKFNTRTKTWTLLTTTGPTPTPRVWFCMSAIGDYIYLFGGVTYNVVVLNDFWRINVNTLVWEDLTGVSDDISYPSERVGCGMTTVKRGRKEFLVMGLGARANFVTYSSIIWTFDPSTMLWTPLPTTGSAIPGRTLPEFKYYDNAIYVHGGEAFNASISYFNYLNDIWRFDLTSYTWTEVIPENTIRTRLHFASIVEGDFWHFHSGDYGSCTDTDLMVRETTVYDFRKNIWYEGYLPAYADAPACKRCKFVKAENTIYEIGGYTGNAPVCTNEGLYYYNGIRTYKPNNTFLNLARATVRD